MFFLLLCLSVLLSVSLKLYSLSYIHMSHWTKIRPTPANIWLLCLLWIGTLSIHSAVVTSAVMETAHCWTRYFVPLVRTMLWHMLKLRPLVYTFPSIWVQKLDCSNHRSPSMTLTAGCWNSILLSSSILSSIKKCLVIRYQMSRPTELIPSVSMSQ